MKLINEHQTMIIDFQYFITVRVLTFKVYFYFNDHIYMKKDNFISILCKLLIIRRAISYFT